MPLYVSTAASAYRTHRLADTVTGQQTKVSRREELPVLQANPNTPGYQPTSIMNRCILWLGAYASRACRCHHPVPPSVSAVTLPLGRVGSWDSQCTIKDPTASLNAEATLNPGATRALPLPPPKTKSRIKLGTAAPPPSASAAQLAKEAERLSATEQASNEQPVAKTLCKFPISHASKRKLVFIRTCSVTMSAPVSAFTKE